DGNAWARRIAMEALEVLSAQDLMGAIAYTYPDGDSWLYTLQPVGDRSVMRNILWNESASIGDMPSMQPSIDLAQAALAEADAAAKRMIIISDGDPAMPLDSSIQACVDAKIAISTI